MMKLWKQKGKYSIRQKSKKVSIIIDSKILNTYY